MMKVVFDTNIILDAAMGRPGSEEAQALIQAVISGEAVGIVTANSITDIHYIVRKRAGEEAARTAVYNTLTIFETVPVDAEACMEALNLSMNDFEDAVLAVCSKAAGAKCIVTRDEGLIGDENCPVLALSPEGALNMLQKEAADWPKGTEE